MLDAAQWVAQRRIDGGLGEAETTSNRRNLLLRMTHTADVAPFEVVGFDDAAVPITGPEEALQYGVIINHAAPSTGNWGIAHRGLEADTIGVVTVLGATWAQVNVQDVNHAFVDWDETNNDLRTQSSSGLARLITPITATGTQWVVICIDDAGGGGASCAAIRAAHNFDPANVEPMSVHLPTFHTESPYCRFIKLVACGESYIAPGNGGTPDPP